MPDSNRGLVNSAVEHLNDRLQELSINRRFEFDPGSRSKGRQHRLIEYRLDGEDGRPVSETKIGASFAEAHAYVTAMQRALVTVLADRPPRAVIGVPGQPWDVKNL